jgi:predicted HAD superfamily phosphohydrolase YqeG
VQPASSPLLQAEEDDAKMIVDDVESNATSSSSAETASLPAPSSNANSSSNEIIMDTVISSSDYNQIAIIADQLFSDVAALNFSGSVLCLYVQALRTHFMTHSHLKRRNTYKRLNSVTTY